MVSLAYCCRGGIGCAKDEKRAAELDLEAAKLGDPDGLYNTGCLYLTGKCLPKDEEEAVKCFRKAAKQLHPRARYNLAVCLADGIGTEKDEEEAVRLCKLVKRSGDQEAVRAAEELLEALSHSEPKPSKT